MSGLASGSPKDVSVSKPMAYILERCPFCKWKRQRPLGKVRTSRHCPRCNEDLVKRIFKEADSGVFLVWEEKGVEEAQEVEAKGKA